MSTPRARADDTERLSRWVREHGRPLLGFLQAMTRDPHAAEDLLQEVFCRAWEARERYEDTGRERGYLLRIADRLVRDRRRQSGRETPVDDVRWQTIEPAGDDATPVEVLAQLESEHQLAQALDALSELQRRTLLMKYYGQLEFHEIAEQLDCPLNTALSHARRGLLALRRLLVEKSS